MKEQKKLLKDIDRELYRKLPYNVVMSLESDAHIAFDRDYKQITDGYPFAPNELIANVYLYDDGCRPTDGAEFKRQYYENLQHYQTLADRRAMPANSRVRLQIASYLVLTHIPTINNFGAIVGMLKDKPIFNDVLQCASESTKFKVEDGSRFGYFEISPSMFKYKEQMDEILVVLKLINPKFQMYWGDLAIANGVSL